MKFFFGNVLFPGMGVNRSGVRMQPFAAYLIISHLDAVAAFCNLPESENAAFCSLSFSSEKLERDKPSM